jgi:hypothetical protein
MKKKVLMSLVVLAIIGTSAVFAQEPTMEKLKLSTLLSVPAAQSSTGKRQLFEAAYKSISGELVIPGTYNGNPTEAKNFIDCANITSVILLDGAAAIATGAFNGCTSLTSITIPASMNIIDGPSFNKCDKLTSVTFKGNVVSVRFGNTAFPGNLATLYKSADGGSGIYTRPAGSNTWTKQIGTEFALQPTMDKLKLSTLLSVPAAQSSTGKRQLFVAANNSISGELVIPGIYEGHPTEAKSFQNCTQITSVILLDGAAAIATSAFNGCTSLTSITIPASMNIIDGPSFNKCDKLTSVTFKGNVVSVRFGNNAFPGNLATLYKSAAGGAGTYTRAAGSDTWTKQ